MVRERGRGVEMGEKMRVIIKIGGSLMAPGGPGPVWLEEVLRFWREGHELAIVHGGGPVINQSVARSGDPVTFYRGQRVTTPEILTQVVQVLKGVVNADLVGSLQRAGITAAGVCGLDAGLLVARRLPPAALGLVGQIVRVNPALIHLLWSAHIVPVVAPLASGDAGDAVLNCNGDMAAQALAGALEADLLVFFTERGGLRESPEPSAPFVREVHASAIAEWIRAGLATEGMVPKLEAAQAALAQGVGRVLIGSYFDTSQPPTEFVRA